MKKQLYRDEFKYMLKASGRKKQWVHEQLGIPRMTFHRAVHNNTLTDNQKKRIEKLLSLK